MSWGALTVLFVIAAGVELIGLEITRSAVDRRRRERDGIGGTQDIAFWGTLIAWIFILAALVSGAMWLWSTL